MENKGSVPKISRYFFKQKLNYLVVVGTMAYGTFRASPISN